MSAAVWCKEHVPTKTIVHRMFDIVDEAGLNALQLYVQKFKQADLTLTGTVRKATLVNQSTKVPNPATVATPSNRKASTTTTTNGTSSGGRGSVSHVKLEEGGSDAGSIPEKKCITCNVDVSPKWWPCPSAVAEVPVAAPVEPSTIVIGDQHHLYGLSQANGLASQSSAVENGGGANMALAAAALHQNTRQPVQTPVVTEFQCHKCHWKKLRREPTPPPPPPIQREESHPPMPTPPVVNAAPEPDVSRPVNQYPWPPPPPSYPPTAPSYNWSRPAHPPQSIGQVNQVNGSHSPHTSNGPIPPINGQPQIRQPVQGIPRSPHENGHMNQTPNGYTHPPSPRRGIGSTPLHMSNGVYTSYATTRPPPQHLTNGGPPPRAPEHPFQQQNAAIHSRPSFGPPHGSPPMPRDTYPQGRELNNSQNNMRPNDGRVNGGASASPSLRNLLS
jgi:hypothetical protein